MKKKHKRIKIVIILLVIILFYIFKDNLNFSNKLNASLLYVSNKSEIDDLNSEIKDLKEELKIDNVLSDKKIEYASIIKRSPNYWYDLITINKGYKNNIKKGDGVLDNNSLIGEVITVYKNTSLVKLITNNKNYISCKFNYEGKDYYGTIKKYNILKNEFYMENVIGDFNNIDGIDVVTSGLSSNYPSGLLIGQIKEINNDKYNLSYNLIIKPYTDFNDIKIVKVVGKK